jgi:apolipoprotein N-acyltransferase
MRGRALAIVMIVAVGGLLWWGIGRRTTRASTRLLARDTLRATVHLLEGRTLYARLGDWPGWLAAAMVPVALVVDPRRVRDPRRRGPAKAGPS